MEQQSLTEQNVYKHSKSLRSRIQDPGAHLSHRIFALELSQQDGAADRRAGECVVPVALVLLLQAVKPALRSQVSDIILDSPAVDTCLQALCQRQTAA